jgi:hypothetical protein
MNKPFIYLAVPYSHPDPAIRELRFKQVNYVAGKMMVAGDLVLSPISHSHPIAMAVELPVDWKYWQKMCEAWVSVCYKLVVLRLAGYTTSTGVTAEIKLAKELNIPIEYVEYRDFL